jgi:murein L,D-transpeptidase YafK
MKSLPTIIFTLFIVLFSTSLSASVYKVDEIKVYKTQHKMEMLFKGKVTKVYTVMLGRGGMGPKQQAGDKKVPEGKYFLDIKNPYSKFYRSIHISYPGPADIKRAEDAGVTPGQDIFIHGLPSYLANLEQFLDNQTLELLYIDWTAGCIAVQNSEMSEIWDNVEVPLPITIFH